MKIGRRSMNLFHQLLPHLKVMMLFVTHLYFVDFHILFIGLHLKTKLFFVFRIFPEKLILIEVKKQNVSQSLSSLDPVRSKEDQYSTV